MPASRLTQINHSNVLNDNNVFLPHVLFSFQNNFITFMQCFNDCKCDSSLVILLEVKYEITKVKKILKAYKLEDYRMFACTWWLKTKTLLAGMLSIEPIFVFNSTCWKKIQNGTIRDCHRFRRSHRRMDTFGLGRVGGGAVTISRRRNLRKVRMREVWNRDANTLKLYEKQKRDLDQ